MTTLVGIKSERETPSVILGSDMSVTRTSWQSRGDMAYKEQKRSDSQKIYTNDSRTAAIGMSGIYDNSYIQFLSDFLNDKFDLEKVTRDKFFQEFADLNLSRWDGRNPTEDWNTLLLATRFDEPKLYKCWSLGRIEKKILTSIGSGQEYAQNYILGQGKLIPKRISTEEGIDIVAKALENASQDIYTQGLDLVVLTEKGIHELGKDIRDKVDSAKVRAIQNAKGKINKFS